MKIKLFYILIIFLLFSNGIVFATNTMLNENLNEKVITSVEIGNIKANEENTFTIYVSPSCTHCAEFLINDVKKFTQSHSEYKLIINFIISDAKDMFILKLLNLATQNKEHFYQTYIKYAKRFLATLNFTKPNKADSFDNKLKTLTSKKDKEMIKFQLIAKEFEFPKTIILEASKIQKNNDLEKELLKQYTTYKFAISEVTENPELYLPLIIHNHRKCSTLQNLSNS